MKRVMTMILPSIIVLGLLGFMSDFKHDETLTKQEEQAIKTEIAKIEDNNEEDLAQRGF